jgi:UDPglucose--hexose-1-phosphate uridylyltransferase
VADLPLRTNPLTGERILVVPGRAGRPGATGRTTRAGEAATCPFCEGNEGLTPPEVDATAADGRSPDSPGWTVRVVPNKYPAVGGQEVVVHGPRHATSILDVPEDVLTAAVEMWNRRRGAHRQAGAAAVLAGINEGAGAGASLAHSHSQLVPFPTLPPFAQRAAEAFRGSCPLCALAGTADPVWQADGLRAVTPSWSRFPYELWLVPAVHTGEVGEPAALARMLREGVRRLTAVLGDGLSWNAALHAAPLAGGDWHWRLELTPRITVPGLIELGAGIWVNVVEPERAGEELRAASLP